MDLPRITHRSLAERLKPLFSSLSKSAKAGVYRLFLRRPKANGHEQAQLDRHLVFSLSKSRIPNWRQLRQVGRFLSKGERWAIRASLLLMIASSIYSVQNFYFSNLKEVPLPGSSYTEGLIGSPKYINPLYSGVSDVDSDLASLVYSALFRHGPAGELVKELAEDVQVGGDNKEYSIRIRSDARWHDGEPLTADDIVFTFTAIKDLLYKSPLRSGFNGVSVERIDDHNIKFKLADPYAAFLELLTFGILPSVQWSQVAPEAASLAELNLKPIGSGPYKFAQLSKDKTGFIRDYSLSPNPDYFGKIPYLDLKFVFYASFEEAVAALNNNTVDGLSYLPVDLKDSILTPKSFNLHKLYLPQLTAIFLNQNHNEALKDKALRQALAFALDRNAIVNDIMKGNANLSDGPILATSFAYNPNLKKYDYNIAKANELLDSIGWAREEVTAEMVAQAEAESVSDDQAAAEKAGRILAVGAGSWRKKDGRYLMIGLKTVDRNENAPVAERIKSYWEAVGVKTANEALPIARIQSEVVKDKQFDALFYGQVLGADPDPYAFWHSSQTGEGGFNIAGYANKEVDQLLEDARLSADQGERQAKYLRFQEIISEEEPAIFVYSPVYTYIQTNQLKGFSASNIMVPHDRFANVTDWYIKTGKRLVWPQ